MSDDKADKAGKADKSFHLLENSSEIHKSSKYASWVSSQACNLWVNGTPTCNMEEIHITE